MKGSRFLCASLLCAVSSTFCGAATINLGSAGNYGLFGLGSTRSISSADTVIVNTAQIYGNVAVGVATGSPFADGDGSFQKGFIRGSLYVDGPLTPASYTIVNKNFTVSGAVFGSVPANPGRHPATTGTGTFNLVPAVQDAINSSAFYATVPGQTALGNLNLNSANMTLAVGNYSATGFLMNSGAILTITGGPGDTFVLNDSGGFDFTKSFIRLTGGISPLNVLFNVTGTGTGVDVSGDNSIFFGNLLAVNRDITIAGLGAGSAQGVDFGPDGIPDTHDDNTGLMGRVIGSLSTDGTMLQLIVHSGAELNVPEPGAFSFLALATLAWFICRRQIR